MAQRELASEDQVFGYVDSLSNWGRWGADDQLGTINLITPGKRACAAALVKDGVTVSCAWPIVTDPAADVTKTPIHYMTNTGESYALLPSGGEPGAGQSAGDIIGMSFHGYTITHVDAPSHQFWKAQMYNGHSSALVNSREGATVGSIELIFEGVVSRGVLLDIVRLREVEWMEPEQAILPEELEAAETTEGLRVKEGDILLFRTGYLRRRHRMGPRPVSDGLPGLQAACLPWLRERGVAMLGSDAIQDVMPSGYSRVYQPIHQIGMVHLGLWLIDDLNLEDLSVACAERNRWEFLLTIAPLRIRYGTGSPVNPIAVF